MREAALRAAITLIAENGYGATSMAQVAEAAGISPSGLAHHFPSRAALLGAVLDHRDALDSQDVETDPEAPWGGFDHLVEVARRNMERRRLVQLYTSVIGEAFSSEHPAHRWMLRHYDSALEILERPLREGQRRGHVRADAPCARIARSTIALMDGLQVQWLLDPGIDMHAELAAHVEDLKQRWGPPSG